jgi:energy-converting hydrogenase Eha subunit A
MNVRVKSVHVVILQLDLVVLHLVLSLLVLSVCTLPITPPVPFRRFHFHGVTRFCFPLPTLFVGLLIIASPTPVTLQFYQIKPNATARGRFKGHTGLTPVTLQLGQCLTGQCVFNFSTNNGTLPDNRVYDAPIIITISTVSAVTACFLV